MENKWLAVSSGVAIVTIILIAIFGPILLREMSIYGYAKVPIQIGYDEPEENWVISTIVSETEKFRFVLDAGTTKDLDDDTTIKTTEEVNLLFEPKRPESKTNLYVTNIKFLARRGVFGIGAVQTKVPMLDIADSNWLTSAFYDVSIYKGDSELLKQNVEVNYQTQHIVYLETDEGTVTINNQGLAMDGVEQPSGDLITVEVPSGGRQIWNKADLVYLIDKWNNVYLEQLDQAFQTKVYTWSEVWSIASGKGWLPQEVQFTHVENIEYIEDLDYVRLRYAGLCFKANVVCFIPSSMADTVIVNLMAPEPTVVSVSPDPLPSLPEGQNCVFYVKVKNLGDEGTISISASCDFASFTPLTPTTKQMEENEVFEFKFQLYALNVFSKTDSVVDLFVQGRGGTDSYELPITITDVEGYTPPDVDPNPNEEDDGDDFPWLLILVIVAVIIIIIAIVYFYVHYYLPLDIMDRVRG